MSKLIMWNIITLDGYFEGEKSWELPFLETVWGPEMERFSLEQLNSTDYLVFGRTTYEGMAAYWKTAEGEVADLMNKLPKIVCSTTLNSVDWNNSVLMKENVAEEIAKLKAQAGKDMYVFGSANLSETLVKENLFDEYRIGIAPVIAGKGRYLFPNGLPGRNLSLISSEQLMTGAVILRYKSLY
ncbi:MAG TPA: dihydrofolate reductase family protein [Chitinophagaceae bacterium]|jgi:dihydrofolate reductase|nr:dihydrofolate reductase family protein [Chitinophagaceae bacterium]